MGTIERALALYEKPLSWRRLQLKGMTEDFGWDASAARYVKLYHEASHPKCPASAISWPLDEEGRQIAR
jgi:starch synthase